MPSHCLVVNCNSTSTRRGLPISFYRIPAIKKTNGNTDKVRSFRRLQWLKAINRTDIFSESLLRYGRVCSKHFITGKPASLSAKNHIDWVPSVLMGEVPVSTKYDKEIEVLDNDKKVSPPTKRRNLELQKYVFKESPRLPSRETPGRLKGIGQGTPKENMFPKEPQVPRKKNDKKVSADPDSLKNSMFKDLSDVLTTTLNNVDLMTNEVHACVGRVIESNKDNREASNQSDLSNEILTLEKAVQNVEGMIVETLMFTDSDLKKKLNALRFENTILKQERAKLKAELTSLENLEVPSQIQPQTIIYNPRDTPTILLVTDDS